MVLPNLALVLSLSILAFTSFRAFPSLCIINEPLISDLRKCWYFRNSSYPLPFVAAVGHPSLEKKNLPLPHACTSDIYSESRCHASDASVLRKRLPYSFAYWWGKAPYFRYVSHCTKPYRSAYYDRSTTTVREQTFDGYCSSR